MANIYNVKPDELIEKAAEELKKVEEIKPTEWASFVKTGAHKERPPVREDWWYLRAASILRNVYRFGPIGVSKLRTKYGGKKNRGVKPERFYKASGNIIRKIMQQLAKAGLTKEVKEGVHKGKIVTPKGISLLSRAADSLLVIKKERPAKEEKRKEKKEEKIKEEKKEAKEEKLTDKKIEEMVKKTKEFAEKKQPTAENLVKEVKKEKNKEKQIKKQDKKNG